MGISRRKDPLCHLPCLLRCVLSVLMLVSAGCDRQEHREATGKQKVDGHQATEQRQPPVEDETSTAPQATSNKFDNYRETGDLADIKKRGVIRFVHLHEDPEAGLPRRSIVSQSNIQLAEELAEKLDLTPHFLVAATPQQAIDMIVNGEADVIADNMEANKERGEILGLTEPLTQTQRVLVTGKKGPDISNAKKLENLELTVLAGSLLAEAAHRLAEKNSAANIRVREVPASELFRDFLDSIDGNDPIVTVIAKNTAENMAHFRGDMKIGDTIGGKLAIVWAVRKDANVLRTRINNFLTKTLVRSPGEHDSDWKSIRESGVLRFATYNGPGYLIWKGILTGLDYDLARKFAEKYDLELKIIAVPDNIDLVELLKSGEVDIAGASTTITESRRQQGAEFTTPILETSQTVLSNRKSPPIKTPRDLNGRTLTLRAGSAFIETAQRLRNKGIDVKIEIAPEDLSYGDIILGVANGNYDATIEDTNLTGIQTALYPQLVAGTVVSEPQRQGWMVAQGNHSLLEKANQFLEKFLANEKNRAMVDNYFEPSKQLLAKAEARIKPGDDLSPYDKLAKKYALKHDFDWRLVVAQMWQESNFNPKAESQVGAQGLLQVMPRTAQEMGFHGHMFDPDDSVHAGTKYLSWVRDRFEDELPADERLWFALAAYNAGIGHLRDARALAKKLGLDPNKWFGNVEVAMLKLSEPRYFEKVRYGYARGSEPVQYVKNISNLYRAYTGLTSGEVAAHLLGPLSPLGPFVQASDITNCTDYRAHPARP
ncbi:transporter substrate-binding domain-containing protein [uncultured Microbulbifer sp.]|uniref:transporter substrate-binding domain-containing protein n=1 Tax=uncultured Microbulbifer sp. TaxID=348147 RepID=UPI0025F22702|nr:transporter substrate-binding domain-containing protein [uncultured Microbulbifer sp.]